MGPRAAAAAAAAQNEGVIASGIQRARQGDTRHHVPGRVLGGFSKRARRMTDVASLNAHLGFMVSEINIIGISQA
jgi:hypothetical protein